MRKLLFALPLLISSMMAGCNEGGNDLQDESDLKDLAAAWDSFHDSNKHGPGDWDELITFSERHPVLNADAVKRVRQVGWHMKWGTRIRDLRDPVHQPMTTSRGAVMYVAIGTSPDGKRLFLNGSVRDNVPRTAAERDAEEKALAVAQMRGQAKPAEPRDWHNQDGELIHQGSYIRIADDGLVIILVGKQRVEKVSVSSLSAEDQEYIRHMQQGDNR